jgi:hypothetical protein
MARTEESNAILTAAYELQEFCQSQGWSFCIIGGLAFQFWGEQRTTLDVDITLLVDFGDEQAFVEKLLLRFSPRHPNAHDFALVNRVLLLKADNGIPMDVSFGALDFEKRCIERAPYQAISGDRHLRVCSADDLVVHKTVASRDKDWLDVASILKVQGAKLNVRQIMEELEELAPLAFDRDHIDRLRRMLELRGLL